MLMNDPEAHGRGAPPDGIAVPSGPQPKGIDTKIEYIKPAPEPIEIPAAEDMFRPDSEKAAAGMYYGDAAGSTHNGTMAQPVKAGNWYVRHRKKVAPAVLVLLLAFGGGIVSAMRQKDQPPAQQPVAEVAAPTPTPEPPKPTIVLSRLTGNPIDPALEARQVTGIMIENSPEARPQSGLLQAGVVFEAIAEGGITRFLALYQEGLPDYIGPVRSLRPYFLDWAHGFDAAVAHVGGSRDALDQVKAEGLRDLDQFTGAEYFQRTKDRYAPHNVYTSMAQLDAFSQKKGYTGSIFVPLPRKADSPSPAPNASSIDLTISSAFYSVHYDWDQAGNFYRRQMGGKPHVDERSGVTITPRVVIALIIPSKVVNSIDGYRMHYDSIGTGQAMIFQDGGLSPAVWTKPGRKEPLKLTTPEGQPIAINSGQTWITAVSPGKATYK
jgi:hypothetical protein